jgi:hypothetical protein
LHSILGDPKAVPPKQAEGCDQAADVAKDKQQKEQQETHAKEDMDLMASVDVEEQKNIMRSLELHRIRSTMPAKGGGSAPASRKKQGRGSLGRGKGGESNSKQKGDTKTQTSLLAMFKRG